MTKDADFAARLESCADKAGVTIRPSDAQLLFAYYELLSQWNDVVNLTGLPLDGYPDHTLERLFIQPLVAAEAFPLAERTWVDIGSGGGSPAVPLKVIRPNTQLTMTEPRQRKVAFLREVIRVLGLTKVNVIARRAEEGLEEGLLQAGSIDIVTVRAVRLDIPLLRAARTSLKDEGRLLSFGGDLAPFLQVAEDKKLAEGNKHSGFRPHPGSPLDLRGRTSRSNDSVADSGRFLPLFVYDCI